MPGFFKSSALVSLIKPKFFNPPAPKQVAGGLPYKGRLNKTADLNTLVEDGRYDISMESASELTNYPNGAVTYGSLSVMKNDITITQEITTHIPTEIYKRLKYIGASTEWSPWVKINAVAKE